MRMLWMIHQINGTKNVQVKMKVIPICFCFKKYINRLQQIGLNKHTNLWVCCLGSRITQLYTFISGRSHLELIFFTAKDPCINYCAYTEWEFLDQSSIMKMLNIFRPYATAK